MNEQYIETNFSLTNGLRMDELSIDSFSDDGTPYKFRLKQSLSLVRDYNADNSTRLKNLIFFDRATPNYHWQSDSITGIYDISISKYKYWGFLAKKEENNSSPKKIQAFPIRFATGQWYLLDFKPENKEEKHHEFMYVDSSKQFHFYRLKEVGQTN